MAPKLTAVQDDITNLAVEPIVNAANPSLLGGGGVDGAIHRRAGRELLQECRLLKGCNTGEAKITGAYKLLARHIIHTVGPVWRNGEKGEARFLADCYRNSLLLAGKHRLKSIATGVYGYPKQQAARIAVGAVRDYTFNDDLNIEVIFCCYTGAYLGIYQSLIGGC